MINLLDKHDCCGCSACVSVCAHDAIVMVEDKEGFFYPSINQENCVGCGLCDKVCPIMAYDAIEDKSASPIVYAAKNKNQKTLVESSSGGVFIALAEYTFALKGVVYGAVYDTKMNVIHCKATNLQNAKRMCGSKYVQSDIRGIYSEIKKDLINKTYVLFTGTPCQVEGLRLYLRKEYDNLLVCDIVCHGVASPLVFKDYLMYMEDRYNKVISTINMKDKTYGWGRQVPRICFSDGTSIINTELSNLWNTIFYKHDVLRPSCYHCRFTNYYRAGDMTIGDYWGIERAHPDFYNNKGISLILINNDKGNVFFDSIKDAFDWIKSDVKSCVQPNLIHPVQESLKRSVFWHYYLRHSFYETYNKFWKVKFITLVKDRIKRIVSYIKLEY